MLSNTKGDARKMIAKDEPWTDKEIDTYMTRESRFTLKPDNADALMEAEILANRLHERDRDGDDRISCAECKQGKSKVCDDVVPKPWDLLQRCDSFQAGPFDADLDLPMVRSGWIKPARVIHKIPHARAF